MLELQHITRRFATKTVIQDLSFTFPDKGVFALMGPSGCGKTTLLRLLAGLDRPDDGTIQGTHHKVAMSFQEPRLLEWLNCENNVKLVLSKVENAPEIAAHWLDVLGLASVSKQYPKELSGGMKQRLSLARALAFGGDLLLLDEPFSALDQELKIRIAPRIRKAIEHTLTILVTHDPQDAELLGATVLLCNDQPLTQLTPVSEKESP